MTPSPLCAACGHGRWRAFLRAADGWGVSACGSCGLHRLDGLGPADGDEYAEVDIRRYMAALAGVRRHSADRLLAVLEAAVPGRRLLDVGAGFGWLLETAVARGWAATGVEPSERAVQSGRARGLPIRLGLFPDGCPEEETFDAAALLDVLEHVPDPQKSLKEIRRRLSIGGVVAIRVPNRSGPIYGWALALARWSRGGRLRSPLARLYQTGFPFPHLHYFDSLSLSALVRRSGFEVCAIYQEPILDRRNLWSRLTYQEARWWRRILYAPVALALWVLLPLLDRATHQDILTVVARRSDDGMKRTPADPPAPTLIPIPPERLKSISLGNERIPSLYFHPRRALREFFWARLAKARDLLVRHAADRSTCLDAGGGGGVFLPTLSLTCGAVTVLDLFIDEARRVVEDYCLTNVRLVQGDLIDAAPLDAPFDVVIAADVLEHFPDPTVPTRRLRGLVKEGGILVTSLPTENAFYRGLRKTLGMKKPVDHYHPAATVERCLEQNGFVRMESDGLPARFGPLTLFRVTAWRRADA